MSPNGRFFDYMHDLGYGDGITAVALGALPATTQIFEYVCIPFRPSAFVQKKTMNHKC